MGQKTHPLGFRLGVTQTHQSQWFAKPNNYSQLVVEDFFLRETILKQFSDAVISTIKIQRKLDQIKIQIRAARPKVIGIKETDLDRLKEELEKKLQIYRTHNLHLNSSHRQFKRKLGELHKKTQIGIRLFMVAKSRAESPIIGGFLVEKLEKRMSYRFAVKNAIWQAKRANVRGIKIQVSGRLNGAEIARSEWFREGRVPLQTLRADIDYSCLTAKTIYGLLGIKVWVFKEKSSVSQAFSKRRKTLS
jgi:small subunit ribosomal protein S3